MNWIVVGQAPEYVAPVEVSVTLVMVDAGDAAGAGVDCGAGVETGDGDATGGIVAWAGAGS